MLSFSDESGTGRSCIIMILQFLEIHYEFFENFFMNIFEFVMNTHITRYIATKIDDTVYRL